jgi:hypothetical protein
VIEPVLVKVNGRPTTAVPVTVGGIESLASCITSGEVIVHIEVDAISLVAVTSTERKNPKTFFGMFDTEFEVAPKISLQPKGRVRETLDVVCEQANH